jgi:hypothetical protein
LSPGGRRPHGGSFPFKRDVDGDGIVLGLLGHEDDIDERGCCVLGFVKVFPASCVPFQELNKTRTGSLITIYRARHEGVSDRILGPWELEGRLVELEVLND